MIKNAKTQHLFYSIGRSNRSRLSDPDYQRVCPVCGKEATSKFFNEKLKQWEYRHKRLYQESIVHHAEK